jgi:hypothetical protein
LRGQRRQNAPRRARRRAVRDAAKHEYIALGRPAQFAERRRADGL